MCKQATLLYLYVSAHVVNERRVFEGCSLTRLHTFLGGADVLISFYLLQVLNSSTNNRPAVLSLFAWSKPSYAELVRANEARGSGAKQCDVLAHSLRILDARYNGQFAHAGPWDPLSVNFDVCHVAQNSHHEGTAHGLLLDRIGLPVGLSELSLVPKLTAFLSLLIYRNVIAVWNRL